MSQPRSEYPRPQFQRQDWLNLNGWWTYAFDFGKSGYQRGWQRSHGFADRILVPFCPESQLSGVGYTDFIEAMWYHREIAIPAAWTGKRVLLHFGAIDYEAEIYLDGGSVGLHYGGSSSFSVDLTRAVTPGAIHHLVVRVLDELRGGHQPGGKQSGQYQSAGCHYTRTTGIWQTVWLEAVHPGGFDQVTIVPDLDGSRFLITPTFRSQRQGRCWAATLTNASGETVPSVCAPAADGVAAEITLESPRPWSPDDPFLYDLVLEVMDVGGEAIDTVRSYAGLRKIHVEGDQVFLNNAPLYQRLVLDQGFYPDGIWTAPSDEALRRDIELSMQAGFNGARLHQKVFEERFHYWADRLGYLTWGEAPSWGCDVNRLEDARNFLGEWREVVQRDRNHPSIIAWTPLNETSHCYNPNQHHRLHRDLYDLTKALDPTRPVNDTSGYIHVKTDLWTVHYYERPGELEQRLAPTGEGDGVHHRWPSLEAAYEGQPYLIDEFGGLKWIPEGSRPFAENTWGYGNDLPSLDAFYELLEQEVAIILANPRVRGYCYTQLTDVEQEQNGIYTYERDVKFDMQRIAAIFGKQPPIQS